MKFEWRLTWTDDKGRPWASELLTAEDPSDARRLHRSSMGGHWVTDAMVRPMVTDLTVVQGGRSVTVEDGGECKALSSRTRADT